MKALRNGFCFLLLGSLAAGYCDKGDVFLFGSLLADPFQDKGPAYGGEAGLQWGVNERTDLQLGASVDKTPGSLNGDGILNARYLLTSYFTPYFGDIRPRLGGSVGVVQIADRSSSEKFLVDAGFNFQGLMTLSSNALLYAEADPNFTLGSGGNFSTLFKVGISYRLSK